MENYHIHITTPAEKDKPAASTVCFEWNDDRSIDRSSWHIPDNSPQFPIIDKNFGAKDGILTTCRLSGGRDGAKFKLVNDVVFEDGKPASKKIWVYCFRDMDRAEVMLKKVIKPVPQKRGKRVKNKWIDPTKEAANA